MDKNPDYKTSNALDGKAGGSPFLATRVTEPKSGRVLEVRG